MATKKPTSTFVKLKPVIQPPVERYSYGDEQPKMREGEINSKPVFASILQTFQQQSETIAGQIGRVSHFLERLGGGFVEKDELPEDPLKSPPYIAQFNQIAAVNYQLIGRLDDILKRLEQIA